MSSWKDWEKLASVNGVKLKPRVVDACMHEKDVFEIPLITCYRLRSDS